MSVEHAVDVVSKVLRYMRELIEKIFESETEFKVVGRVGDIGAIRNVADGLVALREH